MLTWLARLFAGGAACAAGKSLAGLTVGASLVPALIWLTRHGDDVVTCVSWGDLALVGVIVAPTIMIIYLTRPGNSAARQ